MILWIPLAMLCTFGALATDNIALTLAAIVALAFAFRSIMEQV